MRTADRVLIRELQELCDSANTVRALIEEQKVCEDIFKEFTKSKRLVAHIETMLLSGHLSNCFVANIPHREELFGALQDLSSKGHGALIVVERKDKIEQVLDPKHFGVMVDSRISKQLLESIFYPNSPLHDGAVVIADERIFSAGCVLPLSKQTILGHKIGTRHRAALGLSEICDAVSFVVSEETTRISVTMGGQIFSLEKSELLGECKHCHKNR